MQVGDAITYNYLNCPA